MRMRCTCVPQVLLAGYIDALWATHALYITPPGARWLLARSHHPCAGPADYHTHRLCSIEAARAEEETRAAHKTAWGALGSGLTWHRGGSVSGHCLVPTLAMHHHQHQHHRDTTSSPAVARAEQRMHLRASELFGVGHFVQNRSIVAYLHPLLQHGRGAGGGGGPAPRTPQPAAAQPHGGSGDGGIDEGGALC